MECGLMMDFLFSLFNPKFWLMLSDYDKDIDEWLLNAMKHYEIEDTREYSKSNRIFEILIDGKILWISNYPYKCYTYRVLQDKLYGVSMTEDNYLNIRPSRLTIYKFNKKVEKWLKSKGLRRC